VSRFVLTTVLLLAAWRGAQANPQLTVVPAASTLLSGSTRAFQVRSALGDKPGNWVWRVVEGPGSMDAETGVYTAPQVEAPSLVKVHAYCQPARDLVLAATILVLPHQPFDIVNQVLGEGWSASFTATLPFKDLATGRRFDEDHWTVRPATEWPPWPRKILAGCGVPFTLKWSPLPGAMAQLLSYREGGCLVRRDVSGQDAFEITASGKLEQITVEGLRPRASRVDVVESDIQTVPVHVRGMYPFAGCPLAPPSHEDGPGISARFAAPSDLALCLESDPETWVRRSILVADAGSHVIRRVSMTGEVGTPWGTPNVAGHGDTLPTSLGRRLADALCGRGRAAGPTLFNRPTFLKVVTERGTTWPPRWRCLVSDSGNHVIRALGPDGSVTTVAGVPGEDGHRDSWVSTWALFCDPRGLAMDEDDSLYVADRGNRVIRRISSWGAVETFAGSVDEVGAADGPRGEARFTDLGGMALVEEGQGRRALYVVDGHAIRRVGLPGGEVTTPVGMVGTCGFRNVAGGTLEGRRAALRQPCLNSPWGLAGGNGTLHIADAGNRALRALCTENAVLTTLVGDPSVGANRWGLLPDGMECPPDERYAALEAPRAALVMPDSLHVASGTCLAEISRDFEGRDRLTGLWMEATPSVAEDPCVLRFSVEAATPDGRPSRRAIHYIVDFLEADGSLATRRQGQGTTSSPISVIGTFTRRGAGRVVVRCVTDQGVSAGGLRQVEVR